MELPYNTVFSKELQRDRPGRADPATIADWPTKRAWVDYAFDEMAKAGYAGVERLHDGARTGEDASSSTATASGTGPTCSAPASPRSATSTAFTCRTSIAGRNTSSCCRRANCRWAGRCRSSRDQLLIREMILQLKTGRLEPDYFRTKFGADILEHVRRRLRATAERRLPDGRQRRRRADARGAVAGGSSAAGVLRAGASRHAVYLAAIAACGLALTECFARALSRKRRRVPTMLHRCALFQFGGVSLLSGGLVAHARRPGSAQRSALRPRQGVHSCSSRSAARIKPRRSIPSPTRPAEIRGIFPHDRDRVTGMRITDALPRVARSTPTSSRSCAASITRSAATTRRSIAAWWAARRPIRWRCPIAPPPAAPIIRTIASVVARLAAAADVDAVPRHHSEHDEQRAVEIAGPAGRLSRRRVRSVRPRRRPGRSRLPRRERRVCPTKSTRAVRSPAIAARPLRSAIGGTVEQQRRRRCDEHALSACVQHADRAGIARGLRPEPRAGPACAIATAAIRRDRARCSRVGSSKRACRSSRCSRTSMSIAAVGTRIRTTTRACSNLLPPADQSFSGLARRSAPARHCSTRRW